MSFLLNADLYPTWVSESFPILQIILISILLALSVGVIVTILMQTSTSSGVGALSGQNTETFYSKNKGKTLQGLLKRLTIIFAIAILVVAVIYLGMVVYFPVTV